MSKTLFVSLSAACLLAVLAHGQDAAQPAPASTATLSNCLVTVKDEAKVPAQEAGQLLAVIAKEGDEVKKGALLAQIDDRQALSDKKLAEVEAEAATIEASSDAEERVAKMSVGVTKAAYDQIYEANKMVAGAKSQAELRMKQFEWKRAEEQEYQATVNRKLAYAKAKGASEKVSATDIAIQRRQITAPVDGRVVEMMVHEGEWVNPGDPVLHIIRLDRLRVVAFVDAQQYTAADLHARPVQLNVQLAGGRPATFEGRITFVNPSIEPGANKFRVYAEVINQKQDDEWVLQPGLEGTLVLDLKQRLEQAEAMLAPPPAAGPKLSTADEAPAPPQPKRISPREEPPAATAPVKVSTRKANPAVPRAVRQKR
jgi:macrolide-specific efflux system membrane fusion protein